MICLHCGYCCVSIWAVIVNVPEKGIIEDNLIEKKSGVRCKHLTGEEPGQFSCAVYGYPWYDETPCFAFSQVETGNQPCRLGIFTLGKVEEKIK